MEKGFGTELKVGLFAIAGVIVLAVSIITLEGNPFAAKKNKYYTVVENVGGVGTRTQIRTSGVLIGQVTGVEILPEGARINFEVEPKVLIPKGSTIEVKARGVLGDVFLEIQRGNGSTEPIPPDTMIPKTKEYTDIGAVVSKLGVLADDLRTVTRSLSEVLGSPEGKASLRNILQNVEQITQETRNLIASERQNVAATLRAFRQSAEHISALIERNETKVDDILSALQNTTRDAQSFVADLKRIMTPQNRQRIESILAEVDESMKSIRQTSVKVQNIVDKVERGEGSIGQLVVKDDTANEVKATLKSVQDLLKPAQKMKIDIDVNAVARQGVPEQSDNGRTAATANLRISTRPDRFYLIGVTDSPGSHVVSESSTTTTTGPNGQVVTVEEKNTPESRDRLRLNLQAARRFDWAGVRFGLFESTAGVAADVYLFNDSFSASVEVFQFGNEFYSTIREKNRGLARVKGYATWFPVPNLYLLGGVDNLGKQPNPFPFAGLGIRFTDDDLKSILGTAALAK